MKHHHRQSFTQSRSSLVKLVWFLSQRHSYFLFDIQQQRLRLQKSELISIFKINVYKTKNIVAYCRGSLRQDSI